MQPKTKKHITLAVGTAVSLACLVWVFSGIDFKQLWIAVKSISPMWLAVSTALFMFTMYLRAVRWAWLFRPKHDIPAGRIFPPLMIGFAFNAIMPARAGEFMRAYLVGKNEKTGVPAALSTVLAERIFDSVTLLSCLAISLTLLPEIDPKLTVEIGKFKITGAMLAPAMKALVISCGVLVGGVIFIMIPGVEGFLVRTIERMRFIPDGIRFKLSSFLQEVIAGFASIRDFKTLAQVVATSISLWVLIAVSNLTLAYGMDGVGHMTFLQSLAILVLIALAILVPASPGYWGLFEVGCVFSLKVLGIQDDLNKAMAYALVMHAVQFLPIVAVGLAYAAAGHVNIREVEAEAEQVVG